VLIPAGVSADAAELRNARPIDAQKFDLKLDA
jgi:hypothetical protein